MTMAARILWALVALVAAAGGFLVASSMARRSEASDDLAQLRRREARVEKEAEGLERDLRYFRERRTETETVRQECYAALRVQTSNWNDLVDDTPTTVTSTSELAPYLDRARELVAEARQIVFDCSQLP